MASFFDRAKSLSKLWSSKKKEKRTSSAPKASSPLYLTGDTFTMRLMRPEMRLFHRERVRRESMGSAADTASISSTLSEPVMRARVSPGSTHARRHSSLDIAASARTRLYRVEVTRSTCDDRDADAISISSEDQDDLLARVDKMEAELREKKRSSTPDLIRRSASVSDADSGLDSASVVTASSQSGAAKSESKKGVRFLFPDARVPILYPGKSDLDLIRSDDEDLDTDEEYLGTI